MGKDNAWHIKGSIYGRDKQYHGPNAKLQANGTIVGYTVRLKPQTEANRIVALMTIAVEGNAADAVIRALRGDPAVQTLHTTNGRWDIVAELRADSLEAFDRVLSNKVRFRAVSPH